MVAKRTSRTSSNRLQLEALEVRYAPAGNVIAQIVDPLESGNPPSALVIIGDNEANEIRVIEDAPGRVRIEGVGSTTVNGMRTVELLSSDNILSLSDIYLGNGDDSLVYELTGNQFRHAIRIDTDTGDDAVMVFARGVVGALILDTGVGRDNVTLDLAPGTVLRRLQLNTGAGDDTLLFRADSEGGLPALDSIGIIEMEQGNDAVQFEGTFGTVGGLSLFLGAGDDTLLGDPQAPPPVGLVQSLGGSGHDTVLNSSYFGRALYLF